MAFPNKTFVEDARKEIAAALELSERDKSGNSNWADFLQAQNRILAVHASAALERVELQRESNERQRLVAAEINILARIVPTLIQSGAPGDPYDLLNAASPPTNTFTQCPVCHNSYAAESFDACPHCHGDIAAAKK